MKALFCFVSFFLRRCKADQIYGALSGHVASIYWRMSVDSDVKTSLVHKVIPVNSIDRILYYNESRRERKSVKPWGAKREREIQGITEHAPSQGGTAPVKPCGHNHLSRQTFLSVSLSFSLSLPAGQQQCCQLEASNWVLIASSLSLPPSPPPILLFLFQIVSTFSILRCEIHFDRRAENRVELIVYSAWFSLPPFFFLHFFSSFFLSLSRICLSCFAEGRKPL